MGRKTTIEYPIGKKRKSFCFGVGKPLSKEFDTFCKNVGLSKSLIVRTIIPEIDRILRENIKIDNGTEIKYDGLDINSISLDKETFQIIDKYKRIFSNSRAEIVRLFIFLWMFIYGDDVKTGSLFISIRKAIENFNTWVNKKKICAQCGMRIENEVILERYKYIPFNNTNREAVFFCSKKCKNEYFKSLHSVYSNEKITTPIPEDRVIGIGK